MNKKDKREKKRYISNVKATNLIISSTLKSSSDSVISPFIPLYGETLGATPAQIGLIVSITSLLSIFQIVWAKLAEKIRNIRLIAFITNYFAGAFNFIYLFLKNIPGFIAVRGVQSTIASGSVPTSSMLIAERTQTKDWGFWNSILQAATSIGTLIGVLGGGIILLYLSDSEGYFWIFIIAGIMSLLSALLFQFSMPSQKKLEIQHRWMKIEEVEISLNNILYTMKTDRNFLLLCLAGFVFVFGVNLSGPFYIMFNIGTYKLSVFQAAILTSISLVPQTISSILTSRFIEKIRKKELVIMGGIATSFFPISFMLPYLTGYSGNVFWILAILWGLNGTFWGFINSSLSTLILDVIHPRRRALYLSIYNSLNSIALFLGPIIGGVIIQNTTSIIYLLFIISSILRFGGALLFILVKEPVIGGTILRPIRRVLTYPFRSNAERSVYTIIPPILKRRERLPDEEPSSDEEMVTDDVDR
ncbi:MAG: MFS transporter [Candidatus Thorarchaeota archaeon]